MWRWTCVCIQVDIHVCVEAPAPVNTPMFLIQARSEERV